MVPEEDVDFSGTGDTDACEPPCGYWDPDLSPLQVYHSRVHLLTIKPSPRPTN